MFSFIFGHFPKKPVLGSCAGVLGSKDGKEVVQELIKFCSFENLSSLEVNKSGTYQWGGKPIKKIRQRCLLLEEGRLEIHRIT
ncbi:hypothetical protein FF1_039239 [Malus domestica]